MAVWRIGPRERLQDVVDSAPPGTVLVLSPGVYREKLIIKTPSLTLRGADTGATRLVFGDYARNTDQIGRPLGTFRSYSVAVTAPDVTFESLTIVNDAGQPESRGQQVALSVYADGFAARDCALCSTQDTLFLGPLPPDLLVRYRDLLPRALCRNVHIRATFDRCRIEGSVDFIFGGAEAVFSDCEIRSVADGRAVGYVAAPSHQREQNAGFRFSDCTFTHGEGVAPGSVYLARPWRNNGLCSFINCVYGDHIAPAGFDKWGSTARDKTARFYESPAVPGRVPWVNRDE